jgi:hypothetical protein
MVRTFVAGTAGLALCLGATSPAAGQEQRFSGFDGPSGASATVNIRIPLDGRTQRTRPSIGLTVGYGRRMMDGTAELRPVVRQLRAADLRFDGEGLARAELATFDLAHLDQDRRLNLGEAKSWTIWLILAAFASLAVVYVIAEDGSSSSEDPEPGSPGSPVNG